MAQSNSVANGLNLTFTTIDPPGSVLTDVFGINSAGEMVGTYQTAIDTPGHGFLFQAGNYLTFDYPNADSTLAFGINDSGLISGAAYINGNTAGVGFLYNGVTFTTLRAPGDSATLPRGLNNAGIVVGGDGLSLSSTKGFALVGKQFKTVSPPGVYTYVFGDGINNLNQIVGSDDNSGFLFSKGKYQTVAVQGSTQTQPWGINDAGIIVGWYATIPGYSGFAMMHGKFLPINYPGAIYTFVGGINNLGQLVGSYTIDQQTYHGFVTSPITAEDFNKFACCS